jgi:hypothetical protein
MEMNDKIHYRGHLNKVNSFLFYVYMWGLHLNIDR